jgi:hypothetical protein
MQNCNNIMQKQYPLNRKHINYVFYTNQNVCFLIKLCEKHDTAYRIFTHIDTYYSPIFWLVFLFIKT